jgi:diguanylate cyclase (GGDEF)-like protein
MEIKLYFRMLQRGWWIILLVTLVALFASLALSYVTAPRYTATARFIITPGSLLTSEGNPEAVIAGLETLDLPSVVATYTEIMNSQRILGEALGSMGNPTVVMKDYTIKAVVLPESSVLELNVTGPDPKVISDLANSVGYQTILFTRSLNRVYELNFLDQAAVPVIPISPQPLRDAGLSLLLGLTGGAVLAILSEQIRIPLEAYRHRLQQDSETETFNNKHFVRLLNEELEKKSSSTLSIGIIELNGLTDLAGTLPANSLQKILRTVTDTLRRELRGNDVIARWNKKSFIVMLPATSGEGAIRIFNRIHQSLSVPLNLYQYDTNLYLDPHIGGGQYSNGITAQELLQKTEEALEQAKRDGANPVYVWELRSPFWVQNEN